MTTKADLLKAVRAKCLDCCVFQPVEVRLCTAKGCDLHPFRMGKDPSPARRGENLTAQRRILASEGTE